MEETMRRTITTLALGALLTLGWAGVSQAAESHAGRHVVRHAQTVAPPRHDVVPQGYYPQGYYDHAPGYDYYGGYDSGADISGAIGGIGH
jgi:hypothetical protein